MSEFQKDIVEAIRSSNSYLAAAGSFEERAFDYTRLTLTIEGPTCDWSKHSCADALRSIADELDPTTKHAE